MASHALPPLKKTSRRAAPTTILSLDDNLLREVFIRLPSLPSLVRAALACPDFLRAVRSSPAFRRRFRELHSPTILGAFLVNYEPPMPTFAPVCLRGRSSDPDHAAALRGLDVFLTRLPDAIGEKKDDGEDEVEEDAEDKVEKDTEDEDEDEVEEDAEDEDEKDTKDEDENEGWYMFGCCDGYVLLVRPQWNTKKVAVYDPLTGALHLFPAPPDEVFGGGSEYTVAEYYLIPSEADDRSFRVLCVPKENGGEKIAVLSPDTREWHITPTAGRVHLQDLDARNVELVMNGSAYWACAGQDNISVLNTATLQFSQIDRPTGHSRGYKSGETNDGKLCLVSSSKDCLDLDVLVRRAGDDGVDKWTPDVTVQMEIADMSNELSLDIIAECPALNVVAIIGGVVYFSIHQNEPPNWLLSFCLETRKLKKLCRITSSNFCYPYIMAWPPSLVLNKARED